MRCKWLRRVGAVSAVFAAFVAASGCGTPRPAGDPAAGLQPGWNALGVVPWSADLSGQNAFWTGEELIVAGGYDHMDETRVSFATGTYAFSLESMRWRELAPLSVPGYDGVSGASGAWVGSSWVGLALPCRSGPTPDLFVTENCDPNPVGLRWTAATGWAVAFDAVPKEALAPDRTTGTTLIGVSGSTVMLAAFGGMLTIDSAFAESAAWTFTPWPSGLGVVDPRSACLVGGQILLLSTDIAPELVDQPYGVAQNVSVSVLSPLEGLAARGSQAFGEAQGPPTIKCLPDRALLFQTQQGVLAPIQRVTPEGSTPWLGRTTGPGRSNIDGIDVGTGIFEGGPSGNTYTDQVDGETTQLAPISFTELNLWTGETLMVVTKATHQLMALLPSPSWETASGYPFPEPAQ